MHSIATCYPYSVSKFKPVRASIATLVACCLLFAQLATAAFVCPQMLNKSAPQVMDAAMLMADCDDMNAGQPNLCRAHCQDEQQSHDSKSGLGFQAPAWQAMWSLVWVVFPVTKYGDFVNAYVEIPHRPPGSPPLYLFHQVFRL